jgi:hypothetical protein
MALIGLVISTTNRGLVLSPKETWSPDHKFKIHGQLDSCATNPDDHRSISGGKVFVNEALMSFCSTTQKFVTLSIMEAKNVAGVMVVQDMLNVYHLLGSILVLNCLWFSR